MSVQLDELVSRLNDSQRIFRPRASNAFEVEAIPTLGTGKRDLRGLRELALKLASPEEAGSAVP